jgi:endonuclease/exonuclease/phosphatase family metal-dependent hydrolase
MKGSASTVRDLSKVRFGSYNLFNFYQSSTAEEEARYSQIYEVISSMDVDVLAVQEVIFKHPDPEERARESALRLEKLASSVGMYCHYAPGQPAISTAATGFHVGLLWRPGIEPVPGGWGSFTRSPAGLFHSLASLVLDIGGHQVRFASFHGDPFSPENRLLEAYQVLRAINDDDIPGIIGMDSNGMGAARVPLKWSSRWWRPWQRSTYYDEDVYRKAEWFPRISHQISLQGRGQRTDRRAAQVLESPQLGRLHDCAVLAGVPWEPTTGHWPTDPHPFRRPVRALATRHFREKEVITGFRTLKTELTLSTSDHLPVIAELRMDKF